MIDGEGFTRRAENFARLTREVPEIVYDNSQNPILHTPAEEVGIEEGIEIATQLGGVLLRTREITGYGRGLAAPQIDVGKRVFVTYVGGRLETFINPKITWRSGDRYTYRELCLSAALTAADVKRPKTISMEWTSPEGTHMFGDFDEFLARLYQHEVDHLDGHMCTDSDRATSLEVATFDPLAEKLRELH